MPFVLPNAHKLQDETKAGDGDCVDLIKKHVPGLKGVSATQCWRQGESVWEARNRLVPGTAIATFVNGPISICERGEARCNFPRVGRQRRNLRDGSMAGQIAHQAANYSYCEARPKAGRGGAMARCEQRRRGILRRGTWGL